ncbi:MAG: hypothetical protein LKJ03_08645 [Enterococcaceae bacterium]|jgi:uncharacterized small protein (DUF1192 family)|nr:hypothetical protein [Enterococcaceae bacterium]
MKEETLKTLATVIVPLVTAITTYLLSKLKFDQDGYEKLYREMKTERDAAVKSEKLAWQKINEMNVELASLQIKINELQAELNRIQV